ncbi:hypothetical protein EXIGLDRAFT_720890 [Exidia glandulosa HHB12029]|uniref:F-box domain-containing protein n=1 Tax=Exidia glandulosa HHB12029 TaxID=1314781 RepID=A0A165NFB7_EXIGL|nr:hypothetical protein EXIGLDRAFT_720890 [Exidia glandulosa HHB12029]
MEGYVRPHAHRLASLSDLPYELIIPILRMAMPQGPHDTHLRPNWLAGLAGLCLQLSIMVRPLLYETLVITRSKMCSLLVQSYEASRTHDTFAHTRKLLITLHDNEIKEDVFRVLRSIEPLQRLERFAGPYTAFAVLAEQTSWRPTWVAITSPVSIALLAQDHAETLRCVTHLHIYLTKGIDPEDVGDLSSLCVQDLILDWHPNRSLDEVFELCCIWLRIPTLLRATIRSHDKLTRILPDDRYALPSYFRRTQKDADEDEKRAVKAAGIVYKAFRSMFTGNTGLSTSLQVCLDAHVSRLGGIRHQRVTLEEEEWSGSASLRRITEPPEVSNIVVSV